MADRLIRIRRCAVHGGPFRNAGSYILWSDFYADLFLIDLQDLWPQTETRTREVPRTEVNGRRAGAVNRRACLTSALTQFQSRLCPGDLLTGAR